MTSRSARPAQAHQDLHWSPRQREVLSLLASGLTNAQIADRLGISLDGAKWHVSEILSKLAVGSREDAASYWRNERRVANRLARSGRLVFALGLLKTSVAVAGVLGVGIAIGVAVLVKNPGTDAPRTTPTPAAVSSVTTETIDGVSVTPSSVGEARELPSGLVVFYEVGVPFKEGSAAIDLRRAYRDSTGKLVEDRLFQGELANAYTFVLDPASGSVGVGVCSDQATCGTGSFPARPGAKASAYLSRDGGITYSRLGDLSPNALVHAVVGDELLVANYDPQNAQPPALELLPSRRIIDRPKDGSSPVMLAGVGLVWRTEDGAIYRADGTLAQKAQTHGQFAGTPQSLIHPLSLQSWFTIPAGQQSGVEYLGLLDTNGNFARILKWGQPSRPVIQVSEDIVLGNYASSWDIFKAYAMLVDLDTGVMHPLTEFEDVLRSEGSKKSALMVSAMFGPVARITAGVDGCVGLHAAPSAQSAASKCLRDGVLVRLTGRQKLDTGTTWLSAAAPDGTEGWVAEESVRR